MPETMSPREKVALKPCPFCGGHNLKCLKVFSEDEPDHQIGWQVFCEICHAHGPASVRIGWCETETDAEVAWNRRTALASGSGDHAELARLAETNRAYGFLVSVQPETVLSLIAENAALRSEIETMTTAGIVEVAVRNPSVADYVQHWEARATEAERKLAEAVGLLKDARQATGPYAEDVAVLVRIDNFLSKEAERG